MQKKPNSLIDSMSLFKAPATKQAIEFDIINLDGVPTLVQKIREVKK